MKRSVTLAMSTFTASIIGAVATAGIAYADPAAPQPGNVCNKTGDSPAALDNAQTFTTQYGVLICKPGVQVGIWERVDGFQRPVETWFTYGPEETLTADDILPATYWVSAPGQVDSVCTAIQTPADGGPSVTHTNNSGHFVDFALIPNLATLKLSGYCNWRKAWER